MTPGVQRAEIMIDDRIQIQRIKGKKGFGFEKSTSWPFPDALNSMTSPVGCTMQWWIVFIVFIAKHCLMQWGCWFVMMARYYCCVRWGVIAITMLQCTGRCNKTQSWDLIRIVSGHSAARCLLLWQIKMRDAGKILKLSQCWCLELVIQQKSTRLAI